MPGTDKSQDYALKIAKSLGLVKEEDDIAQAEAQVAEKMRAIQSKITDLNDKLGGKVRLPGEQVREFHRAFGMPVKDKAGWVDERELLRRKLILEEFQEFMDEVDARDLAKAAKEAADIIYVLHGMFAEFGVNLDAVFDEVHRSNMSKLMEDGTVRYREDGKVLKGPNYFEPDIEGMISGA